MHFLSKKIYFKKKVTSSSPWKWIFFGGKEECLDFLLEVHYVNRIQSKIFTPLFHFAFSMQINYKRIYTWNKDYLPTLWIVELTLRTLVQLQNQSIVCGVQTDNSERPQWWLMKYIYFFKHSHLYLVLNYS